MVLGPPRKGNQAYLLYGYKAHRGNCKKRRRADLFICEGMYGEPEKKEKAKEYKHMTFLEAADG